MLQKFLPRIEFDSYEDFISNYQVCVPDGFNFAYDVVDAWAEQEPQKNALLYCNDFGVRRMYTFTEMKKASNRIANYLLSLGIKKGDRVMLILKQRPEVWMCFLALHKIGAVCIPATFQLMEKDIVYRVNAAEIRMIISVDDAELVGHISHAKEKCENN